MCAQVWQHWIEKRASDVMDADLGVEGHEHAPRQALRCVHVALLCVQSDRSRRPTMGQVIAMLSSGDDGTEELPEPSRPAWVRRPSNDGVKFSAVLRVQVAPLDDVPPSTKWMGFLHGLDLIDYELNIFIFMILI